MKNKNTITMRADPELKKLIDEIRVERFKCGTDKSLKSPARISLAVANILKFPNIKKIALEGKIDD